MAKNKLLFNGVAYIEGEEFAQSEWIPAFDATEALELMRQKYPKAVDIKVTKTTMTWEEFEDMYSKTGWIGD